MTSTDLYYRATPCVVRFISRFKVMPANAPPLFPDIFGTASQKAKVDHAFGQALKVAKMFRAGIYARVSTFYPRAAQRHGHVQAGFKTRRRASPQWLVASAEAFRYIICPQKQPDHRNRSATVRP